ncbi:MAG: DNA-3-methyladenine glycosylase [Candidatus Zixiibacteriota bacterium]
MDLLGRRLIVQDQGGLVGGVIVETEAYIGEDDPACHAARGRTPRTEVMYGPPGHAYVYFTYGNHWMLNVVAEPRDFPAAVLIRAIEPTDGLEVMKQRRNGVPERNLTNGPGKLTAALGITGQDNGADLRTSRIRIIGSRPRNVSVATSGRVGVADAADVPWRFFVEGNPWVSAYRRGTRASRR